MIPPFIRVTGSLTGNSMLVPINLINLIREIDGMTEIVLFPTGSITSVKVKESVTEIHRQL